LVYKRPSTLQVEGKRSYPPSSREPLERSAHPIVTLFFFNTTQLDIGLLSPRRGLNQDRSLSASCSSGHLKTRICDLDHPIMCRCWKHRQLERQEGGFIVCFPLDVLMVFSPKLTFVSNGNNTNDVGLIPSETICFGSLKFTTDRFGRLSLSPEGGD
jgi:hypothetical protein